MAGQAAVVVWGLRSVMTCLRVMGGFPYSWDDTITQASFPSRSRSPRGICSPHGDSPDSTNQQEGNPSGGFRFKTISLTISQSRDSSPRSTRPPHGDSTTQEEDGVSGGFWAWSRKAQSCQQLCPKLRRVRGHRAWVAGMGLLYLLVVAVLSYKLLKNDLSNEMSAGEVIYFIMDVVTMAVLTFLLFHMVTRSNRLAALVSHMDTLPPGPSLHTWAPTYAAHTILLLVMFLASLGCTSSLFPGYLGTPESFASALISTVAFSAAYILTYIILALYNTLLYLLCVLLATRMRDLRLALEDMREKRDRGGEDSIGDDLRQRVGPVLCDLWRAQTLLNDYLGPPILLLMAEMLMGTISNSYYIFSATRRRIQHFVYWVNDSLNLIFLCHAPALMHDQLGELRYVINRWRTETADSRTEKELTHLLGLLDSYPSFSVAGYYMLSRARLVDIMGFSATYLVVLLQFHVGERPEEASATPTPTHQGFTSHPGPH